MNGTNEQKADFSAAAKNLAGDAAKKIAEQPSNYAAHRAILHDLNAAAVRTCLEEKFSGNPALAEMAPGFTLHLPPFETSALYEKRQNLAAMAGMTLLGWFLGGAVSGLLSLVGMGGDILRVAGVFAMFWLSQYLSASPAARKTILACLGLSGLARMASAALGGFFGAAGLRQMIFGLGRMPNIFKAGWLVFGSFFVFVFMAKKIDGLNLAAFRDSLEKQVLERLQLADFVFAEMANNTAGKNDAGNAARLAATVAAMLDGLPAEKSAHLRQALRLSGFDAKDGGNWLVWREARDRELYEPVGMIKDGDRCLVLEKPLSSDGKIRRGRVQRVA